MHVRNAIGSIGPREYAAITLHCEDVLPTGVTVVAIAKSSTNIKAEMSTDLHGRLLSIAGMTAGNAAIVAAYEWFTHARTVDQFEEIKAKGIPLAWPEAAFPPPELLEKLSTAGQNIICLSIFPKHTMLLLNKGGSSLFKMALHRDALPLRVGLDCTFGGTYDRASALHEKNPDLSDVEIFMALVKDREIVISFDGNRPDVLRVCPKAEPTAPHEKWPRLVDTTFNEIAVFNPDLIGNVTL